MRDCDYLALDGHSLHIFLTVMEQGSITSAATKLGITSSVIGNNLTKLRSVFRDPLFVRTGGQEIVPTARAESLADSARAVLSQLHELTVEPDFNPHRASLHYTIGANDFQRDLILPELYRQVTSELRNFSLQTIIDEYPSVDLLRTGKADLLLSPIAPDGVDILCKRLCIDQPRCFYDSNAREAPRTLADFRFGRYVGLHPQDGQRPLTPLVPLMRELNQQVAVRVPQYSDMPSFVRNSPLLAIAPGMLRLGTLAGFASVKLPFTLPSIFIFMLWHKRHQQDPAHQWMRARLETAVAEVMVQVRRVK